MTSSVGPAADSDLRGRGGEVVQKNSESVLAQLRCPVCHHFVRREKEGQLCENKHYCCEDCARSQPSCPVCRSIHWTDCPPTAALIGEVVLRNELTSCIYDKKTTHFEGCTLEARYETLVDVHEKRCSGRLVTCPGRAIGAAECNFSNRPIQKLAEHMRANCPHIGLVSYWRLSSRSLNSTYYLSVFAMLQTMRQYDDMGSFHYTACKNPQDPRQNTCLSADEIERWPPQWLTGNTISKFLVVFKLILFCGRYIFAVTSFAPKDVCARMSARIRVFQTPRDGESSVELSGKHSDLGVHTGMGELLRNKASHRFNLTRVLPRLEWMGNVVPAGMTESQLDKDPGSLRIPASVIHRLGSQHSLNQLCEVLIDITFSDQLLTQRMEYVVIDDQTAAGPASSNRNVPRHPGAAGGQPRDADSAPQDQDPVPGVTLASDEEEGADLAPVDPSPGAPTPPASPIRGEPATAMDHDGAAGTLV
jgi:hypothetical protein